MEGKSRSPIISNRTEIRDLSSNVSNNLYLKPKNNRCIGDKNFYPTYECPGLAADGGGCACSTNAMFSARDNLSEFRQALRNAS